jgi:hypothetical protein
MDQSATDIYQVDVELMTEAYAREGSPEAAARKLCLIVARNIAGRAMEAAWTTLDGLMPDKLYQKEFLETPQVKTSKPKYNALCPGKTRHLDFYLAIADYMSLTGYGVYSPGDVPWLLPMLRVSDPATKLGSFMKVLSCAPCCRLHVCTDLASMLCVCVGRGAAS